MPAPDTYAKVTARLAEIATELDQLSRELEGGVPFFEGATPTEAAIAYWGLKENYESLDIARKMIYAVEDKFDKVIVPSALERADLDMVRVPGLKRSFSLTPKYSATIIGDKEKAHEWLIAQGLSAIIQPTVNAGTLTTSLKDLVVNKNIDIPDDLFNLRKYNTTGSAKYKPKESVI